MCCSVCLGFSLCSDIPAGPLITFTFAIAVPFLHINAELIFLVTSHVSVTHEEDRVVIVTRRRCHKIKFDLGLLLQGQTSDGQERVWFVVSNHYPPALFTFLIMAKKLWKSTESISGLITSINLSSILCNSLTITELSPLEMISEINILIIAWGNGSETPGRLVLALDK